MVTYLANLESDANEPWSHFVFTSNAADYRSFKKASNHFNLPTTIQHAAGSQES